MNNKNILTIPNVKEEKYSFDIISRLLEDRIIQAFGEVSDDTAQLVINQLLYLDNKSVEPIHLHIHSPGGSVHAGLAVVNTIANLKSPVYTTVVGLAASMGAIYLLAGQRGHRYAMQYSTVMIHQVSSGTRGTFIDQSISLEHTKELNSLLKDLVKDRTNMSKQKLDKAFDRDMWLNAKQALELGVIDAIIESPLK